MQVLYYQVLDFNFVVFNVKQHRFAPWT